MNIPEIFTKAMFMQFDKKTLADIVCNQNKIIQKCYWYVAENQQDEEQEPANFKTLLTSWINDPHGKKDVLIDLIFGVNNIYVQDKGRVELEKSLE